MPAAASAIASAAFAAASGTTILGLSVTASAFAIGAASLAMSAVSSALAPKPQRAAGGTPFSQEASARTQLLRQPIMARRATLGAVEMSGYMTYYAETENKKFHHIVATVCNGEIGGFGTVWLNDEPINPEDIGTDNMVKAGPFKNKVRLKFHTGAQDQVADPDLIAEVAELDENFRGRGVAYIYLRVDWDRETLPNGLPNIRAEVMGQKITDPRTSTTSWTDNAALGWRHYQLDSLIGLGVAGQTSADIDADDFTVAANICDEIAPTRNYDATVESVDISGNTIGLTADRCPFMTGDRCEVVSTGTAPGGLATSTDYFIRVVNRARRAAESPVRIELATTLANARNGTVIDITSAGTGTHTIRRTGEPRYTANGVIESDRQPEEIIRDLVTTMGEGKAVHSGGAWRLLAGAYRTPAAGTDFDEKDIVGAFRVRTRHTRRERFNAVKGEYATPLNDGQPTDYAPVVSSTFQSADGGTRVFAQLDQALQGRHAGAQRVAGQRLKRHRREIVVETTMGLRALAFRPGSVIRLSNKKRNWVNKTFECETWRLTTIPSSDGSGVPALAVETTLFEIDSTDFDWDPATEETDVILPARLSTSSTFDVAAPTTVRMESGEEHLFVKGDGTIISRILATWVAPADALVTSGGSIKLQYRKANVTPTPDWEKIEVDGDQTFAYIQPVEDGAVYEATIQAFNTAGVPSDVVVFENHTVVGRTAKPPAPVNLFKQGNKAFWEYQNPTADFAGFCVRLLAGKSRNWEKGADYPTTHALWQTTELDLTDIGSGVQTLMIKAVDTSGNASEGTAFLTLGLGEPSPANLALTHDEGALGFTGTITNGSVDGSGDLVADDDGAAYLPEDSALYLPIEADPYLTVTYQEMSYGFTYVPPTDSVPGTLSMTAAITGDGWQIEYRRRGTQGVYLENDDEPYLADDSGLYMGGPQIYQRWPGYIDVDREQVDFRLTVDGGSRQGKINDLSVALDVPDVTESFEDVVITSTGTRLPISKTYRAIKFIGEVALQDDGFGATGFVVVDKDPILGPMLKAVGGAQATIDISDMKGY